MRHLPLLLTALLPMLAAGPAGASPDASLRDLSAKAAQGQMDARYELGRRLKQGVNGPVDPVAAVEQFCAAARGGHADAAFALGRLFQTGGLVLPSDAGQAAAWFAKAAAAGHADAKRELGSLPARRKARTAVCSGRELVEAEHRIPRRLATLIHRMAPRYGLEPDLVLAVVAVESSFRSDAVSPKQARGLMQLTDATAERFGVKDPYDPEQNLRGGMRFLAELVRRYDGDLRLVLAAYNAGPGAVKRFDGVPPYAETRAYIEKVRRYFPRDRHPTPGAGTTPGVRSVERLPGTLLAAMPAAERDAPEQVAEIEGATGPEIAADALAVGITPGRRQTARPLN